MLKKLFSTTYIFITLPFLLSVRQNNNYLGKQSLHSYFLDIVLIAQYPVFCVDCTVLGRKTWPNQLGPGQPGQHLNQGRQSMNRTSTVGQLLKGSNTSQRNIQDNGNCWAFLYNESTQNSILQMHILPHDFGRIYVTPPPYLGLSPKFYQLYF